MSAMRRPMARPVEPRHIPAEVVPSRDLDPGYSRWPRWAGGIEELGYIVSETGHPWLAIAGSFLFLLLLVTAVALFMGLAPRPMP